MENWREVEPMSSSSIRKCQRSSEKVRIEDGNNKDRISTLPDKILVHILSFLPTTSVIDKSILSTRWRNLWVSVPVLEFHHSSFPDYLNVFRLMDFVDKVLLIHDIGISSLSKFRLRCKGDIDFSRLHAWIIHVVRHLIEEIDLEIFTDGLLYLPRSLCTSKTLVVLKLGPKLRIQLPGSVWFPSLKILEISLRHQGNNTVLQELLCSCPILENLIVEASEVRKMAFYVAIPTLKRLTINLNEGVEDGYHNYNVLLDTPSLQSLSLSDYYVGCYEVKNVSSIVKASVDIGRSWFMCETKDYTINMCYILKGLLMVKSLSLSYNVMHILHFFDDDDFNLLMFYNLVHIELHIEICGIWPLLLKLFKIMPNLEILELSIVYWDIHDEDSSDEEQFISFASQEVPTCVLSCLKEVEVRNFEGRNNEMNLVKYLLKNAEVLQKVTIDSSHDRFANKNKFREKLLSLPKGSKTCQIKFS